VIPENSTDYDTEVPPADGCYVYGLFLDGGRWNNSVRYIDESFPKELYSSFPYI